MREIRSHGSAGEPVGDHRLYPERHKTQAKLKPIRNDHETILSKRSLGGLSVAIGAGLLTAAVASGFAGAWADGADDTSKGHSTTF